MTLTPNDKEWIKGREFKSYGGELRTFFLKPLENKQIDIANDLLDQLRRDAKKELLDDFTPKLVTILNKMDDGEWTNAMNDVDDLIDKANKIRAKTLGEQNNGK